MGKIKDVLVDKFEIPFELLNDNIKITVLGQSRVIIERHKGIAVYQPYEIKIAFAGGVMKISGKDLTIKNYGKDDIIIDGTVNAINYGEA